MKRGWSWIVGVGMMVGCVSVAADTGKAVIKSTSDDSKVLGNATLTDTPQGLKVVVKVAGVPPGKHGFHIHEGGACGDQGKAAGGHYNPAGVPHGFLSKDGPRKAHAGDMGNIEIGPDGSGTATVVLPGVWLREHKSGMPNVSGRTIIVHEKVDDFSQPTGNAGSRIGCGVIEPDFRAERSQVGEFVKQK